MKIYKFLKGFKIEATGSYAWILIMCFVYTFAWFIYGLYKLFIS